MNLKEILTDIQNSEEDLLGCMLLLTILNKEKNERQRLIAISKLNQDIKDGKPIEEATDKYQQNNYFKSVHNKVGTGFSNLDEVLDADCIRDFIF
jgi:hypothetical protein